MAHPFWTRSSSCRPTRGRGSPWSPHLCPTKRRHRRYHIAASGFRFILTVRIVNLSLDANKPCPSANPRRASIVETSVSARVGNVQTDHVRFVLCGKRCWCPELKAMIQPWAGAVDSRTRTKTCHSKKIPYWYSTSALGGGGIGGT